MKSSFLPRILGRRIEERLKAFPAVVVTGARQTGKTTLVRRIGSAARRLFRSLDDADTLDLADRSADALLTEAPRLTIDEVQRKPELLLAIKRAVDRKRSRGQFLLTGSANLLLMARVADSLAGRAVYLYLRPMTESEKAGKPNVGPWDKLLSIKKANEVFKAIDGRRAKSFSWTRAVLEGGFPPVALAPDNAMRRHWLEGYVQTYLERDLRQFAQVDALMDFRRLMKVTALRVGRLINQADFARDAGLSHATAHRYLNLMEASFLVERVSAYSVSRTKRLVKMPKIFWADPALAAHLAGVRSETELRSHECAGGLLENFVWHHLRVFADAAREPAEVLMWRTAGGEEVDFVLERGRRLLPLEVTAATSVRARDCDHLESFLREYGSPFGLIAYAGSEPRLVSPRIVAVPLGAIV